MLEILPFTLPDWPWGGAAAHLYVYSSSDWLDENGIYHLKGIEGSKQDVYQPFDATVVSRTLLFADGMSIAPTTTSPDRPGVRLTGVLFDEGLKQRKTLFRSWQFPDDLNPLTFEALAIYNAGRKRRFDPKYLNEDQILALLDAAIDGIVLQNMPTAQGLAVMVDGSVVVAEALTTAFSRVVPVAQDDGVSGSLRISARTAGVSFTIQSSNDGDNGYVAWVMFEP